MRLTLAVWFVPVTMLTVGLIVARFKLNQRGRKHDDIAPEPVAPARFQWSEVA
jgi:hypothetical protein